MNAPLIILSGSSGSGKTTLCSRLLQAFPNLWRIITHTTRPPRINEVNGVDYCFDTKEHFTELEKQGKFIETVFFGGHYYGTHVELLDRLSSGQACIVIPDIRGAQKIIARVPSAVTVWLSASQDMLKTRLQKRKTDSPEAIAARIQEAVREEELVKSSQIYQHILATENFDVTFVQLKKIVTQNI